MARRRMVKILAMFDRADRPLLARNCAVVDLAMFNLRPWVPPEPKSNGLPPDTVHRHRWFRNLIDPRDGQNRQPG